MNPLNDIELLIKTLKQLLRRRRITYKTIARELDVSQSTVKRWFSRGELSLKHLSEICIIAGVTIFDLASMADRGAESLILTETQEQFFSENIHYFAYFNKLFEGMSPKEIAAKFQLSKRSTEHYLKTLSEMKLIRYDVVHDVELLKRGTLQWEDNGILGSVVSGDMIEEFSKKMVKKIQNREDVFVKTVNWKVRQETVALLKERIEALFEEFGNISAFEGKVYPQEQLNNLFGLFTLDQDYRFSFYEPVELFEV